MPTIKPGGKTPCGQPRTELPERVREDLADLIADMLLQEIQWDRKKMVVPPWGSDQKKTGAGQAERMKMQTMLAT